MNKVELLAPAGSFEALKAAVAAGADAVYLGGSGFGARAFAKNFENEEMIEAIKFAHLYNVKIYVTLNTLIYDHEMNQVFEYVKFLYHNDVDAIIVQDLGLMQVIKKHFPDLEIHASTQMTIHNLEAVKFLKSHGIDRIVLARENTIDQIKRIVDETGLDIEVFVHGALCVCYSGQCFMSGLIGGRSGNRGKCAQPCRKKYTLKVNEEPIVTKQYLLSPKDLNTIEHIDQMIQSGIKSLKIEGRMKSPEYVAIVVSAYRKAIDSYYENNQLKISEDTLNEITQIFNRKFTKGFLFYDQGNDFINLDKNNNTGLLVGKVLGCENKKVKIKLIRDLNLNDGIYFDQSDVGLTVSKLIVGNKEVKQARANEIVTLDIPNPVVKNSDVYKTTDVLLEEKARLIGSHLQTIPINMDVFLFIHQKPKIKVTDDLGNIVIEEVDFLIEESKNQLIDNRKVIEQLNKLGNTPFVLNNINIHRDDHMFITMGALNNLRRTVLDKLISIRQVKYHRPLIKMNYGYKEADSEKIDHLMNLSVYVRTFEQLQAALNLHVERIYVDEELKDKLDSQYEKLYIAKGRIEYQVKLDPRFKGMLISQLGALSLVDDYQKEVISNFNLNITNSESIQFLTTNNVDYVTLSYELNENSYKNLFFKDKSKLEIIVFGYQEAMITKHCIYASNCQKQCKVNDHGIMDEKHERFNIYMDRLCHMHILNSKKLMLLDEVTKLKGFGYRNFRLQFTIENYKETAQVIEAYQQFIFDDNHQKIKSLQEELKESNNYTRGYYNKSY